MSSQEHVCPICKKPMRPDRPFIEHEIKQGSVGLGQAFPSRIEMRMFENYICHECETRVRKAVQVAIYENPQIQKLV